VAGARAELCGPRCVGCGACVPACSREAIESDGVRLHILVGGRMGRHPRWAEQLCAVHAEDVIGVLDTCLDHLTHEIRGPERPADIVERVGMEALRRRVLDIPSGYSLGDQKE
jgi:dissimilatory sulfite reductase (desulfoviridin) alpha/beta subunit